LDPSLVTLAEKDSRLRGGRQGGECMPEALFGFCPLALIGVRPFVGRETHETDFALAAKSANLKRHDPNLSSPIDDGARCIATDDPRLKGK
jgi:hypothetical protein